jgi:hypothetical protein
MRKLTFSFTLFFFITLGLFAQDYNTGIGIRAGTSNGLTVKHFIGKNSLIEGIFITRRQGYNFTGLYEIYRPAFNVNRLNWFYGFGAHIGSYRGGEERRIDEDSNEWLFGIDGIIGMEYNFVDIPFNISLDWKPAIDFTGGFYPWGDEVAFSLRYIF